jgi:hypothetical protein
MKNRICQSTFYPEMHKSGQLGLLCKLPMLAEFDGPKYQMRWLPSRRNLLQKLWLLKTSVIYCWTYLDLETILLWFKTRFYRMQFWVSPYKGEWKSGYRFNWLWVTVNLCSVCFRLFSYHFFVFYWFKSVHGYFHIEHLQQ